MMIKNMFRTFLSFHPCLFCLKPRQLLKEFRMSLLTLSLFRPRVLSTWSGTLLLVEQCRCPLSPVSTSPDQNQRPEHSILATLLSSISMTHLHHVIITNQTVPRSKITMDEIGEKQFSIPYENYSYQDGTDKNITIETSGLFTNYYHLWEQQKS